MIINQEDNIYVVKLYKSKMNDVNIYDIDDVSKLFKNILMKLRDKYNISGLCVIEVYVNKYYGMIVEVDNIYNYGNELDVKIKMHIDYLFMNEINNDQIFEVSDCYLYNNKYYSNYNYLFDSAVVYKDVNKIIKNGIKIK